MHQNSIAQADTLTVAKSKRHTFMKEPLKATMLAFAFPGLGQIYNRKYWKIPLVYAGFGAMIYAIGFNTSHYNTYLKGYQDFTDNIPETNSYLSLVKVLSPSEYDPVLSPKTFIPANASWVKDGLLQSVDYYKKYRDLSYIGVAFWYLISALDANVDASLFNYDISDKLSLNFAPLKVPLPGYLSAGLNLSLTVTF
jgi:hypothetical protein